MPLFGTLEPDAEALGVCDGYEQRIKPHAAESISLIDGGRIVPGRAFHAGCYGTWSERMKARADSNEPVDVAPPINAPKVAPEPAACMPEPDNFGSVSMDDWLSAFDLTTEAMERGRHKRTGYRNGAETAERRSLLKVH